MNRNNMSLLTAVMLALGILLSAPALSAKDGVEISDRLADRADTFLHLDISGYGDHAFVLYQKDGGDAYADIQRFSLLFGYQFADWIDMDSRIELEQALSDTDQGKLSIEELRLDFKLTSALNVRAGRILLPSTHYNLNREPTSYYSVQIPEAVETAVPGAGFGDGVGVYGQLSTIADYELYLTSGVSARSITPGSVNGENLQPTTDLTDPAITARLELSPDWNWLGFPEIGLFAYASQVESEPDSLGQTEETTIVHVGAEVDAHPSSRLHLRGWVGHTFIDDPNALLPGAAEHLYGWYVQGAYNVFPAAWKHGKLEHSSVYVFSRYSDYDTQYRVPGNIWPDTRFNRNSITAGLAFYATPKVVIKADYENRWSVSEIDPPDLVTLGLGWMF